MISLVKELSISPVYSVSRGASHKRLRIKSTGVCSKNKRMIYCGMDIPNSYYTLVYIDGNGNIKLKCQVTGEISSHSVGVSL